MTRSAADLARAATQGEKLLFVTLIGALAASWLHLVEWLARYEHPSRWWIAALTATAIDLGVAAGVWASGYLSRRGATGASRRARWLVIGMAGVSAVANTSHALDAAGVAPWVMETEAWRVTSAAMFAGVLPVLVVILGRVLEDVRRVGATAGVTVVARQGTTRAATPGATRGATAATVDATAVQRDGGDPRDAVRRLASQHPKASRRELARLARTSDTTVRRMIEAGELRRNGAGWEVCDGLTQVTPRTATLGAEPTPSRAG